MTTLKLNLNDNDPAELALGAEMLSALAQLRARVDESEDDVQVKPETVSAVVAELTDSTTAEVVDKPKRSPGRPRKDPLAQAVRPDPEKITILTSDGQPASSFEKSSDAADAFIEILKAAPSAESLTNMLDVNKGLVKALSQEDVARVIGTVTELRAPKEEEATPEGEELFTQARELLMEYGMHPAVGFVKLRQLLNDNVGAGVDNIKKVPAERLPELYKLLKAKLKELPPVD